MSERIGSMVSISEAADALFAEWGHAERPADAPCNKCGVMTAPRQVATGRWVGPGTCDPCEQAWQDAWRRSVEEGEMRKRGLDHETLMRRAAFSPRHLTLYEAQRERMRPRAEALADLLVEGQSVYLWGDYGTRKSTLAIAVGLVCIERHRRVRFWGEEQLITALQTGSSPRAELPASAIVAEAVGADVMLWDDFGMRKRRSDAVDDWTQAIVSERYNGMRSTVYTSNTPPDQLGELVGERSERRITETSVVFHVTPEGLKRGPR